MTPLKTAKSFGYQEARLDGGEWEVTYFGNTRRVSPGVGQETQVQRAIQRSRELALWRAAQITLKEGKVSFDIVRERVNTRVHRQPGHYSYPISPYPWGYHPHRYPWGYGHVYPWGYYSPPRAHGKAWVTIRIRLHAGTGGRYDARRWRARMIAKYGPAIPPPQKPGGQKK